MSVPSSSPKSPPRKSKALLGSLTKWYISSFIALFSYLLLFQSVVLGLLLAQTIGLFLSTPGTHQWRIVFLVSAGLCALQILLSAGVSDTPHWLTAVGRDTEARAVAAKLHQDGATGTSTARSPSARARSPRPVEAQRLLDEGDVEAVAENGDATETSIKPLTVTDLFKLEPLRAPVIAILLCMFSQQISGINAGELVSSRFGQSTS